MPIYQFLCDEECLEPYEIIMSLKDLEKYDNGDEEIPCPKCKKPLRKLICPPKMVRIR